MAQTFRTDPDTGRTVISQDNVVGRQMNRGERVDPRISRGDPRGGYEGMNAPTRAGTGYMSRSEFEAVSGMTDTNPYGNDGFFSRVFGIDPSKIDYTSNLGPRGIENVKRQAYDRFMNPFARVDAFGRPTMGADPVAGTTRSGVQPGDLTIFGPAIESRQDGIAGLFQNTMLGAMMPKRARVTGYDTNVLLPDLMEGPAVGGGTELPGIPYFTSSTNPPLARDAGERRGNVPESTYRPLFTDDVTVADIIAAAPMVTSEYEEMVGATPEESGTYIVGSQIAPTSTDRMVYTIEGTTPAEQAYLREIRDDDLMYDYDRSIPTGSTVLQNIPGGDPGSASITVNPQSESPTYTAPDEPVDLLQDILAPDGSILPGVMDVIAPPQTQRSGGRDIILVMPDGRVVDSRNIGR